MGTSHETAIFAIIKSKKLKKAYPYLWVRLGRPVFARTGMGKCDFGIGRVKEGWDMNNKHFEVSTSHETAIFAIIKSKKLI